MQAEEALRQGAKSVHTCCGLVQGFLAARATCMCASSNDSCCQRCACVQGSVAMMCLVVHTVLPHTILHCNVL